MSMIPGLIPRLYQPHSQVIPASFPCYTQLVTRAWERGCYMSVTLASIAALIVFVCRQRWYAAEELLCSAGPEY